MEPILFGLVTAVAAFAGSRFTRLHPLAVAVVGAIIWGGVGGFIMMLFASEAWPVMAVFAFMIGLFPSGIGAFLGWLRRTHVERVAS